MPERQTLWTRAYLLLCLTLFLVSGHQAMVLVVIPLYVVHLGASAFVAGLVLFAFSLPSFVSRPFVGHWADSWNLVGVYTAGGALLGLATPFYLLPLLYSVVLVSMIRALGWAGAMTGSYALLARLSPSQRKGEASGYFSSVFSATNILFPALGLWLVGAFAGGYRLVFALGGVLALSAALTSQCFLRPAVPEGLNSDRDGARRGSRMPMLERSVFLPTVLSFSLTLAQPAVIAFLPLYARHQGIPNIALYFVLSGMTSLVVRPLLGQAGDRIGHGYSIVGGFVAQMAGVSLIMIFGTLPAILIGGMFNALGNAVCSAATLALAVARSDPRRQGAAMGTFTISFQMGNGIGSLLAGTLVSLSSFRGMYTGTLVILAAAVLLALTNWSNLVRPASLPTPEPELAG